MPKIIIPTKLETVCKELLEAQGYEVIQDGKTELKALLEKHNDAVGLVVRSEKITAEVIDMLPALRLVVRAGAGYNTIDIKHARSRNVAVMNTPGANSNAVAEEAIGLMIAGARYFLEGDKTTRAGLWEKNKYMGSEITGKTVGILGFGNIGQLLAKRLRGFDVKLKIYDPFVSLDKAREYGAEITSMEDIFATCDFLSLHLPATKETDKIISTQYFSLMKDGAVLVNCARSEVLDEEALREARKTKRIVFCNDVYDKDEAGLKTCNDIADIMLPHLGASTFEANNNAARMAANQTINFLDRGLAMHVVNKSIPDGLAPEYQQLSSALARFARSYIGAKAPVFEIQASFYGKLKDYSRWLIPPIVAAISGDNKITDIDQAEAYLKSRGISCKIRDTDEGKRYGESITVDLISGTQQMDRVSVRGTLTEGNIIVSRIGEFGKLYYEPTGHTSVFVYDDRPGVLAQISQAMALEGLNIEDIRSPHNDSGSKSIAILKLNAEPSAELIEKVGRLLHCHAAFTVHI
jgi:D-3-phosphoglycerate dehydrogenase / 2-oxoglutarate reductase